MSFTPEAASKRWDKVPTLSKRLQAMKKVQRAGWKIAVRFEPVIGEAESKRSMRVILPNIQRSLSRQAALGKSWRVWSAGFHKNLVRLYPDEDLLARDTVQHDGMLSLAAGGEALLEALEDRPSVTSIVRVITDRLMGFSRDQPAMSLTISQGEAT